MSISSRNKTCVCDICRFPVELQGEICRDLSLVDFARLRSLSKCWNLRFQLFGPGKGVIAFGHCNTHESVHQLPVAKLSPQQIAAGHSHTLALTPQGEVHAWGDNAHGQLGDGTMGSVRGSPVRVCGELESRRVVHVECGLGHSLALTDQGEVYAWGWNHLGQLGDGTTTRRLIPVRVGFDTVLRITQISAGPSGNLALTSTGEVYGWGDTVPDQVACLRRSLRPFKIVSIPSDERVVRVVAGYGTSYALTDQGHLYAWGRNHDGQLGDGTTIHRPVPQRVPLPHRIVHVEASTHVLALTDQGEVYAWGANRNGQLGDGTTTKRLSPMQVGGPLAHRRVTQIAVGTPFSLAVTDQGEIFGWGSNGYGQLGDGTEENRRHTPHLLPYASVIGRAANLHIAARDNTFFVSY